MPTYEDFPAFKDSRMYIRVPAEQCNGESTKMPISNCYVAFDQHLNLLGEKMRLIKAQETEIESLKQLLRILKKRKRLR